MSNQGFCRTEDNITRFDRWFNRRQAERLSSERVNCDGHQILIDGLPVLYVMSEGDIVVVERWLRTAVEHGLVQFRAPL